jgi:hypothetical protein
VFAWHRDDVTSHRYRFTAPLWIWDAAGEGSWHFVTVPEEAADEIKAIAEGGPRRGFGSVRVEVTVGPSTWRTSIFPGQGAYVLPVKKAVRTKAGVEEGDDLDVDLTLVLEV